MEGQVVKVDRRRLRKKWVPTPQIDAVIRAAYQKSAGKTPIIRQTAKRIGWPRWAVSKRAGELGLSTRYQPERVWSSEELAILEKHSFKSPLAIQQRLQKAGFGRRTETSIVLKRKRLSLTGPNLVDGYSPTMLAKLLGIDGHTVQRWIASGRLKAQKREGFGLAGGVGEYHWLPWKRVRAFIVENPTMIDLRKVDALWFIDLLGGRMRQV